MYSGSATCVALALLHKMKYRMVAGLFFGTKYCRTYHTSTAFTHRTEGKCSQSASKLCSAWTSSNVPIVAREEP